ncbi:hypothetical protein KL932_004650 [Ogataea haglerorum]|uniref:uncharacterized protein n=1 Tax=Ogataea haglerorum TaxID=1937702 RepID=UPI001C892747|nr:uncharacterized protein KL911_005007 [Ogataea haglerorum]KAG7692239.1 hypothetical protein KL915_004670 [Ogataea haglerorum]KAG7703039.1 hypothetical protein KL914_004820 [Ogataea haglerorum]KAG7703164.1 hypothetical protein KL950_004798 [Ogataea haglerorum]KAG7735443.1 hypothetical protein KL932_004650 [Ogataea haglerorum]KAG7736271.1 hypothetical protein KL923_004737 [Ogataea haglerorum]
MMEFEIFKSFAMSGCIVRAVGWKYGAEERFLGASPTGETVSLYQTNNNSEASDEEITKLFSRGGFDKIQCLQYSSDKPGVTGVGQLDGSGHIFDITAAQTPPLVLRPKQARSCNSISFNERELVALGFDRGRQDHSIQIWDLASCSRAGKNDSPIPPLLSFVPNESVSSLSFCEGSNIIAGSYKLLREYDVRTNQPVYQLSTRCTLHINVDPFYSHFFASASEDGSLAIWDRRKLGDSSSMVRVQGSGIASDSPLLLFSKLLSDQRRSGGSPYRYSTVTHGELGALFDGDLVRRWKFGVVPPLESEVAKFESMVGRSRAEGTLVATNFRPTDSLFISRVSDAKTKYERVISFDYSPNFHSQQGIDLVCMRQSGSIYKMHVVESPTGMDFNSFNDLTFTGPEGTCSKMVKDAVDEEQPSRRASQDDRKGVLEEVADGTDGTSEKDFASGTEDSEDLPFEPTRDNMGLKSEALLGNDICSTIRRRALLGYGTNAENNMTILESMSWIETTLQLRNAWKWISISHELVASGKMISGSFDFGYLGVLGIWHMEEGFAEQKRYNGEGSFTPRELFSAARHIVEKRALETKVLAAPLIGFEGESHKEVQRRFAMHVIGWDFGVKELEDKYESLIAREHYERAAGWAVFHGDISRAIDILASSKNETYRIMSTAIAGYFAFRDSQINTTWKDQCRKLSSDLENPYLRVIFGYIADGNWWDVLDDSFLPLREKLGVALRFLPDSELDVYLTRLAENVIKRGEIEGIILTGVTALGMDLLQSFVDRTSDIQSACLIASFGCPKYFKDDRVEDWVENYRYLLNSWSLFHVRAKFDVARMRLSRQNNGEAQTIPVPRQVFLQCTNCHKNISKKKNTGPQFKNGMLLQKELPLHTCPHCGHSLPRCAICLITQGISLPKEMSRVDHDAVDDNLTLETQFKEWFSFCLSCNHGMHAGHAEEWFSKHYICPVPDCDCRCNNR